MREYFLFAIIIAIHPINAMEQLTRTQKITTIALRLKVNNIVVDEAEIETALDREERFLKREKALTQKGTSSNTFDFTPESAAEYAATRSGVEN